MSTKSKIVAGLLCLLLASSAASAEAPSPETVKTIAPQGRLRAAINLGNPVLAQKDSGGGEPHGVSVELARALGRELGVPVDLVIFNEAVQVSEALKSDRWDICFLAIDPIRAAGITFTAPYVLIEGIYVVPTASALHEVGEIDKDGMRVGVAKGSAYDLFLTRALKHAQIVRVHNATDALALLAKGEIETVAGVKQPLIKYIATHPELRALPGRFMEIDQAMGLPKTHEAGLPVLKRFIADMKASGFIAKSLAATGQGDATIAP